MTRESERTRVVLIHPSVELYGSDRMFLEAVEAFCTDAYRVDVVLPGTGALADQVTAAGASVHVVDMPTFRKSSLNPLGLIRLAARVITAAPGIVRLLRRLKPDVVYVSTLTTPMWGVLATLTGSTPVVTHVHEAETQAPRLLQFALVAPLSTSREVLVNSRLTAEFVRRSMPFGRSRIRLVPNGVEGPTTPPPKASDAPPDRLSLLMVGRLSPRKGTHVAVDAVLALHRRGVDTTLHLVGDTFEGYEWYEEQLRERVLDAGLSDSVIFSGFTANPWQSYAAADVVLVPSVLPEPFGNVAVEAHLAQVPVIGSSHVAEALGDGEFGLLVPPDDAEALAEAIHRLPADWEDAQRRAARARTWATNTFSPQNYRHQLRATIDDVTTRRARSPRLSGRRRDGRE